MKFPITRERLQAFDPIQEKKEKDEIIIQNHINPLVQDICHAIERIMSWTIRKPDNKSNRYINEEHQTMMVEKRYIYKELINIRRPKYGGNPIDVSESILIPRLVEKLKENFIGCNIILDPLNTYIIIDWS